MTSDGVSTRSDLEALLSECCGSRAWVMAVAAAVPAGLEEPDRLRAEVLRAADDAWAGLSADDWRAAFAAHAAEVTASADEETLSALRVALRLYEEQFGHAFVSSATIRSPEEFLMRVRIRLGNEAADEWNQARDEQRRGTRQRLEAALAR